MELFHEMYGCYYHVVGQILQEAHQGISRGRLEEIVRQEGFSESGLHLLPRLLSGEWDLLREQDGHYYSKLAHRETDLPLTLLEKSWLKALLQDERMPLFLDAEEVATLEQQLGEVEPLFCREDFHVFDAAADGDPYGDAGYIARFRLALGAIRAKTPLRAQYKQGKGGFATLLFLPEQMLYSGKDDKFRILGRPIHLRRGKPVILNMARLQSLEVASEPPTIFPEPPAPPKRSVQIAIYPERNALERCMLQFASYDKQTVFDEERNCHLCDILYHTTEEAEILIRILSFGPVVEVLGPAGMLAQVRERVFLQQKRRNAYLETH